MTFGDSTATEPVDERRSALMRLVRAGDTGPELIVRRAVHALGYRFRLHSRQLPGTPDIVFPSRRAAIFVHGCFWHRHPGCRYASTPKTRREFWYEKFERNVTRDARVQRELAGDGWAVHVVWECEVKRATFLEPLLAFLGADRDAAV